MADLSKILTYARYHKLTTEHNAVSPMSFLKLPKDRAIEDITERIPPDIPGIPLPSQAILKFTGFSNGEKLQVPKSALDMISFIDGIAKNKNKNKNKQREVDKYDEWEEYQRIKRLKLEEPLLYYSSWKWEITATSRIPRVRVKKLGLKTENGVKDMNAFGMTNEENEEAEKIRGQCWKEKLEVNTEAMTFLKEIAGRKVQEMKIEMVLEPSSLPCKVTPPLEPMDAYSDLFYPSIEYDLQPDTGTSALDIEDDPTRLAMGDQHLVITREAMNLLESKRKLVFERSSSTDEQYISSSSNGSGDGSSSVTLPSSPPPPNPPLKLSDLYVDVPLLSLGESLLPVETQPSTKKKKKVRFSDVAVEIPQWPPPESSGNNTKMDTEEGDLEGELRKELEAELGSSAKMYTREIEQEQLVEADGINRVPVPIMDFSLPKAPWDDASDDVVRNMKQNIGKDGEKWNYRRSIDIDELVWRITGDLEGLGLHEKLDEQEEGKAEEIIGEFLHKTQEKHVDILEERNFRFIDENGDEDDLEYASLEQKNDLDTLIRRKKVKSDEKFQQDGITIMSNNLHVNKAPKRHLSTFLSLRNQSQVASSITRAPAAAPTHHPPSRRPTTSIQTHSPPPLKREIPTPSITDLPPRIFIVSTTLLLNRRLYKHLETFYPNATFVERDLAFAKPTLHLLDSPNSKSQLSANANTEPDIIASPTAAMVVTTIQKVRQKPLPGQKLPDGIRDRAVAVGEKYDTLVVLVSYTDDGGLGKSDTEAYASFVSYVISMCPMVKIILVEDGGDGEEVARWTAAALAEHGVECEAGIWDAIADERTSMWESFLRQAGFNLFAARVLTTMLHVEDSGGLLGFVAMTDQERRMRYGSIVGERVLKRFDAVVGARWL